MGVMKIFIKRVNEELEARDMRVDALAEKAKIHHTTLYRFLNGSRKTTNTDVIDKLAKALGLEPWELMKPKDKKPKA